MIQLTNLEYELKYYVEIAYREDEELFKKYHVAEYNFNDAVSETMRMIYITSLDNEMKKMGVVFGKRIIGYVCFLQNNLYSFGINIKYRKKEILTDFFDKIKEILGESFICMLYPNNTRAINWLKKCGMVEVPEVEKNIVTLLNIN